MPEEIKTEGLSISDAFDKGLAADNAGSPKETEETKTEENADKTKENESSKVEGEEDKGKTEVDQTKKEPIIDPEKGKYEGEYTKERFDKLMSAWQKDRTNLSDPEKLKAQMEKLGIKLDQPLAKKEEKIEIELPEELQNADEASKEGYKLMMRGILGHFSKVEQNILGKVSDILNAPIKKDIEFKTKVDKEMEDLSISGGKLFEENKKEILKFAGENEYPLGTLNLAFKAWKREQELSGRINDLTKGKKIVEEINNDDKKNASLPKNSKGVSGEMPVFDAERDGNKSIDDIYREVSKMI